jgi:hypothetical protein
MQRQQGQGKGRVVTGHAATAATAAAAPWALGCLQTQTPARPVASLCAPVCLGGGGALNQVIAVDGGGDRGLGQAGLDELQHSHLGGGVLHRHAVCRRQGRVAGKGAPDRKGGWMSVH